MNPGPGSVAEPNGITELIDGLVRQNLLRDPTRRAPGRGPRRFCSSSAAIFSRHNASSHIRSSAIRIGPNAACRAR